MEPGLLETQHGRSAAASLLMWWQAQGATLLVFEVSLTHGISLLMVHNHSFLLLIIIVIASPRHKQQAERAAGQKIAPEAEDEAAGMGHGL